MDSNRFEDGIALRYRFGVEKDINESIIATYLDTRPCSVLEMMCALALRCEEHIMSDPDEGNRTGVWFWGMIHSLGLDNMTNAHYDYAFVKRKIGNFLEHRYLRNGKYGLFTVEGSPYDMRQIEIWEQLMLYLNQFN